MPNKKVFTEDELVEIFRLKTQDGLSQKEIADRYGCGKSTIGDFLRGETYKDWWGKESIKPTASGQVESPEVEHDKRGPGVYVVTSAQNNTYVFDKGLRSLHNYCKERNAELLIPTYHYNKNAYSKADDQDTECWFDPKITPFICNKSIQFAEDLLMCGELDVLPTAKNPLNPFFNYTREKSGIIPHAKVALKSLPTPKHAHAKLLYSTGTITQRNYIQRVQGQIAQNIHQFSALVIEVEEDGTWFVRQLIMDDDIGSFYDLDKLYTPDGVVEGQSVTAVNYGDIHAAKVDPLVAAVSWGPSPESILNFLKPEYQFLHDVYDHKVRNHHNIDDPYFRFRMHKAGTESVEAEVKLTTDIMQSMLRDYSNIVVVESNHDLALEKWLKEQDYKKDPVNAMFFLRMQLATYMAIDKGYKNFSIFEYACKVVDRSLKDVKFLKTDESFMLLDSIEYGSHGHNGNNGARGSARAFQVQGRKFNTGHTHSCEILDGVYIAGVSGKLDMGYNVGGSSWTQSHILTYNNGKRCIVTIKNGKWRGTL